MGYLSPAPRTLNPTSDAVPTSKLPAGGNIGLFSPSEPLIPERLTVLTESLRILEQQGYNVTFAPNARAQGLYAAGTAHQRAEDIHALALDPAIDILLGTWGGKSCNQVLDHLNFDLLAQAAKPVVGFSDISVLLNALTVSTSLNTFHFLAAGRLPETTHADLGVLTGSSDTFDDIFDFHADHPRHVIRPGTAQGRLFGGNLSTFVLGLLGTRFLTGMQDIIFFWESASERPQIVDQHLVALRNAGFFDRIKAMVIGSVYSGRELSLPEISQAIEYATTGYDFPILYSPSFGHHPTSNPIVPIGAMAALDSSDFRVRLLENAVVR
jgi:muramoyltetrapeptide carboxypeptidase